jgi:acyl-CoA synthetase (AMP-forming)/AMP-acid ligase II
VGLYGAPLFHIAGVSGFCTNLTMGATTVISPSGGFDPVAMVDLLERERVSSCFFVPAQLGGDRGGARPGREVALTGVADARFGEAPLAVIAPRDPADPPTTADVEAFCRERLAACKRPRDVVIIEALPRNPSGKVLKTRLRAEYGDTAVVAPPAV